MANLTDKEEPQAILARGSSYSLSSNDRVMPILFRELERVPYDYESLVHMNTLA